MGVSTQEPTGGNWAACWGIESRLFAPPSDKPDHREREVIMTVLEGRHQGGASQGGNAVIQGSFSKQPICQLLTVSHEAGPPPEPPCLPLLVAAPVILLQTDSEF